VDAILPRGHMPIRRAIGRDSSEATVPAVDERRETIVEALARGRRVIVHSAAPIDALARDVWRALPFRVRLRASVATWAFDNANRFDLVAMPKLAGVMREPSDLVLAPPHEGTPGRGPHPGWESRIPDSEFRTP
jgi:hypothetical protein